MAALNALAYHVNGEAVVAVGTGTSGAAENLGVTEDGVTLRHNPVKRGIITDVGGPETPAEFQTFPGTCMIQCVFPNWNDAVLRKLQNRVKSPGTYALLPGGETLPSSGTLMSDGTFGVTGGLVGTLGETVTLAVSGEGEDPYYFPSVIVKEVHEVKLGTEYSKYRITFFGWRYIPATRLTALNLPLWLRAIP